MSDSSQKTEEKIFSKSIIVYKTKTNWPIRTCMTLLDDGFENTENKRWWLIQIGAVDFDIFKVYVLHPYTHTERHTDIFKKYCILIPDISKHTSMMIERKLFFTITKLLLRGRNHWNKHRYPTY